MASSLTTGRIVWASIADANGVRKLRPAIIVTPSERLAASDTLEVVAVTTRLPKPLPEDHVLLPWHAQGHPRTGLNRPSAAVCTWLARITTDDIDDRAGLVPSPVLASILEKVAAALSPGAEGRPPQPGSPPASTPTLPATEESAEPKQQP